MNLHNTTTNNDKIKINKNRRGEGHIESGVSLKVVEWAEKGV